MDKAIEEALQFYDRRYDYIFRLLWRRDEHIELGDRSALRCRFCGKEPPAVKFENEAHAVPEALGNRGLTTAYECDSCNKKFGNGIENHLGEWSKPYRTAARIKGKKGVPTLAKGAKGGWRIEYDEEDGFDIKAYEDDPTFELDIPNKRLKFTLKRGSYVPVAVYKAFVKCALALIPENELEPFAWALDWISEKDHTLSTISQAPIIHTFQNGPMPNDKLMACVLRRKFQIDDVPYCFLIIGYGNDVFQVGIPAPEKDQLNNGKKLSIIPFPTPGGPDPMKYGRVMPRLLDLTGTSMVRGETVELAWGFEAISENLVGDQ